MRETLENMLACRTQSEVSRGVHFVEFQLNRAVTHERHLNKKEPIYFSALLD